MAETEKATVECHTFLDFSHTLVSKSVLDHIKCFSGLVLVRH